MKTRIEVVQGDITKQQVDAIANAANTTLLGGGGVDGAIHRAAGPELLEECRTLHGCRTGEAKITRGYNLPAKHVLHTVGPIITSPLTDDDRELLASCYRSCLKLAEEKNLKSVAFCCISTGVFRFPKDEAARIAVDTVREYMKTGSMEKIIFCVHGDENLRIYQNLLY